MILQYEFFIYNAAPVRSTEAEDCWKCRGGDDDLFSVKSAYVMVSDLLLPRGNVNCQEKLAFKVIWNCPAPSKVSGFAWLVLRDRVPTRENLIRCRVLPDDGQQCCVFCGDSAETVPHLVLYCNVILQVWDCIFNWLGLKLELPHSILSLLNFLATVPGSKQKRKGLVMVCNAVIWSIWRHRNKAIFDNGATYLASLFNDVKTLSWKWWIGRSNTSPCLFYEWNAEPMICLSIW
jgi:hypothetical protein